MTEHLSNYHNERILLPKSAHAFLQVDLRSSSRSSRIHTVAAEIELQAANNQWNDHDHQHNTTRRCPAHVVTLPAASTSSEGGTEAFLSFKIGR